jgi:uncharacterized membrane protein
MNNDLTTHIKHLQSQGHSTEHIYLTLIHEDHTVADIQTSWPKDEAHPYVGRATYIITALATLFISAGLFSLLASNWEYLSDGNKVGTIIVLILLFHSAGLYVAQQTSFKIIGEGLKLLGTITFGVGIFLIGQIYNFNQSWADGFALWMIGAVIYGLLADSYTHYGLAFILGVTTVIGAPVIWFDSPNEFSHLLLTSSWLLIACTILSIAAAKKISASILEK